MTETTAIAKVEFTRDQVELIKHTVAIGASDNELKLFLYQAQKRGLDPLSRQIHFIKRKRYNPDTETYEEVGTIQTGIDGFRLVADRTGKLAGIKRGVVKEGTKLVGAWAEIYRSDWKEPAREEVNFDEYCQKKKDGSPIGLWKTMPETMIKKVAEAAALRMAFPEDLSGIYSHEEMQQADTNVVGIKTEMPEPAKLPSPAKDKAPTEWEVEEDAKHFCKEHNAHWFKRGRMPRYAHPIKDEQGNDTGKWCNEPEDKPEATPEASKAKSEPSKAKGDTKPPTWEELRVKIVPMHDVKKEGWSVDGMLKVLVKLGATALDKPYNAYASLPDEKKLEFAELVNIASKS